MINSIRFFVIAAVASMTFTLTASERKPCTGMTHAMIGKELMAWYSSCIRKQNYSKDVCKQTLQEMQEEHRLGKLTQPECLPEDFNSVKLYEGNEQLRRYRGRFW